MPPATRSERPPSRPPLTSRIRASFENKRTKSSDGTASPAHANEFITQDPEAMRSAVDKAMNSEAFHNAIAANIARLLKPTIKEALDTIQPIVETVYSHEILLGKMNKSVENILERMDSAYDADHFSKPIAADKCKTLAPHDPVGVTEGTEESLTEKAVVEPSAPAALEHTKQEFGNNAEIEAQLSELSSAVDVHSGRITEVVDGLAGVHTALVPTTEGLESLKSLSEQSNTAISVMQAQLDQLKEDVGAIIDAVGSDLRSHVKTIKDHVSTQNTSLLSSHTMKLDAITMDLAALKGHSDEKTTSSFESRADLKTITADLISLNDSIKASMTSNSENVTGLGAKIDDILGTLEAQTAANSSPDILAAVQKLNEWHVAHSAALEGIRSPGAGSFPKDAPPNLEPQLATIISTLESHSESHASHAAASESHATALQVVKSLHEATGTKISSNLEPQLAAIISTLESHSTTLGEFKPSSTAREPDAVLTGRRESPLRPYINTIVDILESQNNLLNEIRDDVSAEILTTLHDIKESHQNHQTALNEIREADVSDEILTALHSSNDSHMDHAATLGEIRDAVNVSNGSHAAHSKILDQLKTARSQEPDTAQRVSNTGEVDFSPIIATLKEQENTLTAIKEATDSSNESHAAHSAALAEIKNASLVSNEAHASHAVILADIKDIANSSKDSHNDHATSLGEIKEASLASNESHAATLAELKQSAGASKDSYDAHTASLEDVKGAINASKDSNAATMTNLDELKDEISALKEFHNSHAASLEGIKETTNASRDFHTLHEASLDHIKTALNISNESNAAHAASLEEIKDAALASKEFHISHGASLAELKAIQPVVPHPGEVAPGVNLAALETQLNTIATTLEIQRNVMDEVKDATDSSVVLETVKSSQDLLTSSHEDILTNLSSLRSIIEDSTSKIDEHGAAVKELHETAKSSHSKITTALTGLAVGGATSAEVGVVANADNESSKALLDEVKAVRKIVERSSETITSMTAQIDINHTTVTTSITTLTDELKAEMDASGTEITTSIAALSEEVKEIDGKGLSAAIEGHRTHVKELSGKIKEFGGHVQEVGGHVGELKEGVQLNERGVGQLKEHFWTAPSNADSLKQEVNARVVGDVKLPPEVALKESQIFEAETTKDVEPIGEGEPIVHYQPAPIEKHVEDSETEAENKTPAKAPLDEEDEEGPYDPEQSTSAEPDPGDPTASAAEPSTPADKFVTPLASPTSQFEGEPGSASTTALPLSSLPESGKKGNGTKKGKKEKKPKKDKNVPFVFDPEDEEEA